jgi:DNA ligase (NAD+)
MSKSIEDRIQYLKQCANLYETNGNSPLTDLEYDREYAECKRLSPEHSFFSMVGGIDASHVYGTEVKHKYVMGSLNKDPNPDEFGNWFSKTYPSTSGVVAVLQLKVDGSSFCLKYQDGKLIQAVTRGDGEKGFDFTPNALHIAGVKKTIAAKGYVEVKGEVYKNRHNFYRDWAGEYENPRNFTAGSINQKDPLITKERGLSFVAYEVRGTDFKTETDKMKFLVDNGFENLKEYTAKIDCSGRKVEEVVKAIQKYMDKFDRDALPFDVDGIVFKLNDISVAEDMGYTDDGKRPKANRAVKFPTDQKPTILEDIEWSVGRTGTVTPVGLLKAVRLAGTTVRRVSLHNIKELGRLGIDKLGAEVLVEKAGDIIPKIVKKISDGNKKLVIPTECPCCGKILDWDDTETNKVCNNEFCAAQLDGNIEHWFKKLDVKGIGPGIITKVTSKGIVKSISDMYKMEQYKKELADMFGDRASEKIFEAIDSVKEVSLAKFIEALGIGKIGTMAKDITAIAPTVKDIDNLKIEEIKGITGFAETKARSFVEGWKEQRKEIEKILNYVTIKEVKLASAKLSGKKFCFTGSFSNPTRGEMEKLVEDNGGKLSSVSKELTALVWDGEIQGGKMEKAKKLGLTIFNQKDFMSLLK